MTKFGFTTLLPRHVAVKYLKLKFDTGKAQKRGSTIGCISKTLFILYSTSIAYFISVLQSYSVYLDICHYNCPFFNYIRVIAVFFQAYTFVILIITCSLEKHC